MACLLVADRETDTSTDHKGHLKPAAREPTTSISFVFFVYVLILCNANASDSKLGLITLLLSLLNMKILSETRKSKITTPRINAVEITLQRKFI